MLKSLKARAFFLKIRIHFCLADCRQMPRGCLSLLSLRFSNFTREKIFRTSSRTESLKSLELRIERIVIYRFFLHKKVSILKKNRSLKYNRIIIHYFVQNIIHSQRIESKSWIGETNGDASCVIVSLVYLCRCTIAYSEFILYVSREYIYEGTDR